jgi:DNA repair protein RecO (recombination protein O)
MLAATDGILLQLVRHTDRQNIIRVYTRRFGMMSLLVAAGRKKKSSAPPFHPMLPVDLQITLRENRSLCRLNEMHVLHPLQLLLSSPVKTAQALLLAEVILKSVKEEESNETLFDFILNALLMLDQHQAGMPDFHLRFILDLSKFLGFFPDSNYSEKACWFSISEGTFTEQPTGNCFDATSGRALASLLECSYSDLSQLRFNGLIRRALLRDLLRYYQWHLHSAKDFKTPAVLEVLFS